MGKTPSVLRARSRQPSEGVCAPESRASSATLFGPEESKSAIPSLVAAWIACAAIMPGQMYSIGLDIIPPLTDSELWHQPNAEPPADQQMLASGSLCHYGRYR